ncbi:hypothetical protein ISF_07505 [Cordyceps fumosorosea ARSEF 2679]|uniref:GPI anchored serine-threonine rich protein n=1 Tax=Cordyceps fumosorosea (strain ARSEF 2679) TaxID=1081104 RepID=A0A167P9T4_CORFA|nr:hypothetical protein ISF_07505 [Cordyceps fumosorosea ARSEF 2679]OAA56437.1 hypothetical protein ISF_07505 [Cordyceps fumosorosea ARSEF 2679]
MHALAILSLVASSAGIVAAQQETYASFEPLAESLLSSSPLEARQDQSCASLGGKACGTKCIQLTYSCCGNGAGACQIGYVCGIAANDIWGCCPIGKRCRGDAPEPSTTIIGGSRPTSTVDDDEPTSAAPTTRVTPTTTTRRLTPAATSARTTALGGDDEPTPTPTQTRSVPTSVIGGGNGGSTTTSVSVGGGNAPVSSAGIVGVSLAGIAGGLIVAIASLL